MTEWWTYELSDFLMFAPATWYRLLELHNAAWSPLHALVLLASAALPALVFLAPPSGARIALALLAAAWLFVAWAFHWSRYAPINWAASWFAAGFLLQGLLLLGLAATGRQLHLSSADAAGRLGVAMLLLALLYPLLAPALGRSFAPSEWFGLMPDPTVLATLGVLLCLRLSGSRRTALRQCLLVTPIAMLWCAATGATLWTLHAKEWWLLPLAALLCLASLLATRKAAPPSTAPKRAHDLP